jgi:Dyp-type peroxidase family
MLELDQIQATLLRGARFNQAYYLLARFGNVADGRTWVRKAANVVTSTAAWDTDSAWTINLALTYAGLEALGLPQSDLATFPEEFRAGMAARGLIGDVGGSDPARWEFGGPSNPVHALVIVSTRDSTALETLAAKYRAFIAGLPHVETAYVQPGWHAPDGREHFGFHDPISQPAIEGSGVDPLPGQSPIVKAGEFVLGYPDEHGQTAMPSPTVLGRNGSYLVVRKFHQKVADFRAFLAGKSASPAEAEKLGAKMVGRWPSGAPLVLAPDQDDPTLGADPCRNNDFLYDEVDPKGLRCPLGSHGRRTNPRDTAGVLGVQRHRILRGGSLYGPKLPDGAPDDGAERGVFLLLMGASISRQFEFVHNLWINDGNFVALGTDKDPLVGANEGGGQLVIPRTPIRRRVQGIPRFTVVRGGDYFFIPSLTALRYLAGTS